MSDQSGNPAHTVTGDVSDTVKLEGHVSPRSEQSTRVVSTDGVVGRLGVCPPVRLLVLPHYNADEPQLVESAGSIFRICNTVPGVIAAGGCVSRSVDPLILRAYSDRASTAASDLDLYVRANSVEAGYDIVRRVLEVLKPWGDVTLTKYALSFEVEESLFVKQVPMLGVLRTYKYEGHTRVELDDFKRATLVCRVQILSQLIPDTGDIRADIGSVISKYDMAMCSFATDGRNVYSTEAGVRCMFETRVARVHWSRLTDPKRLAKYYNRSFDFEIIGPDDLPMAIDPNSRGALCVKAHLRVVGALENQEQRDTTVIPSKKEADMTEYEKEMYAALNADNGYDSTEFVWDTKKENSLDWSMRNIMELGHPADDESILKPMVHGDGVTDVETVMSGGRYTAAYLTDWQCRAMGAFCEKFLAQDLNPANEVLDAAYAKFISRMEPFVQLVKDKLRVTPLFGNGHRNNGTPNTDFDAFRRFWCEPITVERLNKRASELPSPAEKRSRGNESASIACYAPVAGTAAMATVTEPSTEARIWTNDDGRVPEFDLSHSSLIAATGGRCFPLNMITTDGFKRLELIMPELDLPCGIPISHGRLLPILCSLGENWETVPERASFHSYIDRVQRQCISAAVNHDVHKPYVPSGDLMTAMEKMFTPIIYQREHVDWADHGDQVLYYPPAMIIHYETERVRSVLALQNDDGTMSLVDTLAALGGLFNNKCTIRAHIRLEYMHRKRVQNSWGFSVHCSLLQGIIRQYK